MNEAAYFVSALISLGSVLLLTPVSSALAVRLGAVDYPGERKIHGKAIPRLGGLAIFMGIGAGILSFRYLFGQPLEEGFSFIILGAVILVGVGIWDDLHAISSKQKLLGQIFAVLAPAIWGPRIEFFRNPFGGIVYLDEPLSMLATLIWIIALINTVNLIDGMDGLAAGVVAIAAGSIFATSLVSGASYGILALVLSAACLGFLRYNFHPASIFMGDSGSMLLGYIIGVLTLVGMSKSIAIISLFSPLMVMGIPIFDTAFAIVRRAAKGMPITEADDGHLHHRLLKVGNSQRKAVLIIYVWSLMLSGGAIALKESGYTQSIFIVVFIMLVSIGMMLLIGLGERAAGFKVWSSIRRFSLEGINGSRKRRG